MGLMTHVLTITPRALYTIHGKCIKIMYFSKLHLFQNYVFFKITSFSKLRLFQNYVFFKITYFSKLRIFQYRGVFKNLAIFKITKRGGVDPLPSLIINMFFCLNKILHWLKMNKGDFCLIGQFFLRLSLINLTSGSGRLEKADKDFKKQQGQLA